MLRARAGGPGAVGAEQALRRGGVGEGGPGPRGDVGERRQLARSPGHACGADAGERVLGPLERGEDRDEQAEPEPLLGLPRRGQRRDLGVEPGRRGPQLVEPRGGPGELVREPRGVGRGAQPGDQVVLVAVVGGAAHPPHDELG